MLLHERVHRVGREDHVRLVRGRFVAELRVGLPLQQLNYVSGEQRKMGKEGDTERTRSSHH